MVCGGSHGDVEGYKGPDREGTTGGPRGFRPAHIHYMVQARGYKKLITQLYFAGDRHLKTDRWASQSNLIIQPQKVEVAAGEYELGTFDIVLDRG